MTKLCALALFHLLVACAAHESAPAATTASVPAATVEPAAPTPEAAPSATAELEGGFVLQDGTLHLRTTTCGPDDGATGSQHERLATAPSGATVKKLPRSRFEARVGDQIFVSRLTRCGYQLEPL